MLTRDLVAGFVSAMLGLVYLLYATTLRVSSLADSFGPRGMPLVYGWLTLGLGFVLMVQAILRYRATPVEHRLSLSEEWKGQGRRIAWAAGLFLLALGYVLVLPTLGYLVAMALLLVTAPLYLAAARSWRLVATAILGALVLWMIFVIILDVSMPAGLLAGLG